MSGGKNSPFYAWLAAQPTPQSGPLPVTFQNLALAQNLALQPPPYPAMIISPDHYLQLQCQGPPLIPSYVPNAANCSRPVDIGQLVYLNDPLNSYYDSELTTFFKNAVSSSKKLVVMGDGQDPPPTGPWTVQGSTKCPLYLTQSSSDQSLLFQDSLTTYPDGIIICDPRNQIVPLQDANIVKYSNPGQTPTATITLTSTQCTQALNYKGWNFAQPSSGWVGNITKVDCGNNTMTLSVLRGQGTYTPGGGIIQNVCNPVPNKCGDPNPNWSWVFTNIAMVGGTKPNESPSDMVFANDGAFGTFMGAMYVGKQQTVAKSIGRNIVTAFNHGIANCNNVAICSNLTPLTAAQMNPPSAAMASDAYWSNEANWYPARGLNNYYTQYLHTYQLPTTTNIFSPPQPVISPINKSNQGIPMGMAYGFAYDENPGYVNAQVNPPAQVPSKFDPIPSTWFTPANNLQYVHIMIGRSVGGGAANTHDFNSDGYSDIAWRNTNGDTAIYLMTVDSSGDAKILSMQDYGIVPNGWSIVGQRDFNGDGKADLLWSNTNGDNSIWLMNGTAVIAQPGIGPGDAGGTIVGTGDFNGDGFGDILWRNTNGHASIWLMTGNATQVQVLSKTDLGVVPMSWSVAQTGDFNGDGKADILWHNTNGDTSIWLMTGTATQVQVLSRTDLGLVPTSWNIAGTGDFNSDGFGDILWLNNDGDISIWLMTANGTKVQVLSAVDVASVPAGWNVAVTGDFNGDGTSDILWRNTDGDTSFWFMGANETQVEILSVSSIGVVPPSWVVQGAGAD
jgi:FG-GAP-like repeat